MTDVYNTYRDGKIHVGADKCTTCIFRPDNLMHLQPGRVKDMVDGARADDSYIVCHQTLPAYGDDRDQAVCRGWWDGYRHDSWLMRLADEWGLIEEVPILP